MNLFRLTGLMLLACVSRSAEGKRVVVLGQGVYSECDRVSETQAMRNAYSSAKAKCRQLSGNPRAGVRQSGAWSRESLPTGCERVRIYVLFTCFY